MTSYQRQLPGADDLSAFRPALVLPERCHIIQRQSDAPRGDPLAVGDAYSSQSGRPAAEVASGGGAAATELTDGDAWHRARAMNRADPSNCRRGGDRPGTNLCAVCRLSG